MRFLFLFLFFASTLLGNTLQTSIDNATNLFENSKKHSEYSIPPQIIRHCKGIAVITVLQGGLLISAKKGSGFVITRSQNHWGWSAPSAISTGGLGIGLQVGAKLSQIVLVLNTDSAVNAFLKKGKLSIGGHLSAAAGPVGKSIQKELMPKAAVYIYSKTEGGFIGAGLESTLFLTQNRTNKKFYGKEVSSQALLKGKYPPPKSAYKLYQTLNYYQNL